MMKTIRLLFSSAVLVFMTVAFANAAPANGAQTNRQPVSRPQTQKSVDIAAPAKTVATAPSLPVVPEPVTKPPDPVVVPAAPAPGPAPAATTPVIALTNHDELMQAAGISQADWATAEKIIKMESSWNVNATEPHTGACGLAQELPCGKSGCDRYDAVCELRWANTYVISRYGGWAQALAFHLVHGWY